MEFLEVKGIGFFRVSCLEKIGGVVEIRKEGLKLLGS